ncbi:hypothetical protein [Sphingomonas abaci]|uniref:Uncharacterized protein n=1 Tax=Sphingomonas abaci TaxID=237611 RepID=A0A7W7AH53_9SPHN|nr:hypothetical protein [Sphingomonas abaci]MBB4616943.1 hypothetical protein [Sphingomonas abaci]
MTLEQQISDIMSSSAIDTMQICAQRESDGSVRFYSTVHDGLGLCAMSDLINLPTVREAIESGIKKLNEKRLAVPVVADLVPMERAA